MTTHVNYPWNRYVALAGPLIFKPLQSARLSRPYRRRVVRNVIISIMIE